MKFINQFNRTLLIITAFIFTFLFATAAPVPAKFFVSTLTADVGQTIEFDLRIEGTDSVPVYTVISSLEYDKNLLTFRGASYQPGWIPVTPDEVTDTTNGLIKRTAGYPVGLKQTASLVKYTFVARAPGDAVVNVKGGSAYDANSTDLGLQNKSITVKIGGKKEEAREEVVAPTTTKSVVKEVAKEVKKAPQTVSLEMVGNTGYVSSKDYTFVVRHNLKVNQETLGTTTLTVLNSSGGEVMKEDKTFAISENSELLFTIPANSLQPGNYTFNLSTIHDNQKDPSTVSKDVGVVEMFEKVVIQEVEVPFIPLYVWAIIGFLVFLILLMTIYSKSKKFRKFLKNF